MGGVRLDVDLVRCAETNSSGGGGKKWKAIIWRHNAGGDEQQRTVLKTVRFGAAGYDDYTTHHDSERKTRYLARHKTRENWRKSGVTTAGFWSRWLLWNKPSLAASIADTSSRFNLDIRIRRRRRHSRH